MIEEELVVSACVKIVNEEDSCDIVIIPCIRHLDRFFWIIKERFPHYIIKEQGFVTNRNRYLTREQAYELVKANGQYSDKSETEYLGKLFSEDIY